MMTGPLILATAAWVLRPITTLTHGFTATATITFTTTTATSSTQRLLRRTVLVGRSGCVRLFATDPSQQKSLASLVESSVSRLSTLQTLLQRHGAPGSQRSNQPNDLIPILGLIKTPLETSESMTSMSTESSSAATTTTIPVTITSNVYEKFKNLHPYLFPICQSTATGNLICAYRDPRNERDVSTSAVSSESDSVVSVKAPKSWPIVEAKIGGPGMTILALNSEHLLRRIVCELDFAGTDPDTIYVSGSVTKLGYGVDKYVLLKVGPFADLYEQMARQHYSRGDESSALIAAETANGKLSGFASTFRFYSRLLSSFPNRAEEVRPF
jgi:hypothetical protein